MGKKDYAQRERDLNRYSRITLTKTEIKIIKNDIIMCVCIYIIEILKKLNMMTRKTQQHD